MLRTSIVAAAAVILLTSSASALAQSGSRAAALHASSCQPYRATGQDAATSPAGPYVGLDTITIGTTTYPNVPTVITIVAPLTPQGDSGVLATTTTHAIALPTGTITTTDNVHLIPTQTPGVYRLVSHLVITSGATGQLQLQGTLNLGTLSAQGVFVGTICGLD